MTVLPGREQFFPVTGADLYIEVSGDGEPVILIHGWTLDHRMWAHQVEGLADHYRVVGYDRRGFGRSSGTPRLPSDLQDLDALVQTLTPGAAVLFGASQGARVALRYTLSHPQRVRALVIQGAPLDGYPPPADAPETIPLERWSELARSGQMDRVRAEWLDHPLMATAPDQPKLRRELQAMINVWTGSDLLHSPAPDNAAPVDPSRIQVPALIVEGERETPWRRRIARKLAMEIPGARLSTIAAAGHLANMDNPGAFNREVSEFLSGLS